MSSAEMLVPLKGVVMELLSSEEYLQGKPVPSGEPLMLSLLSALFGLLSDGTVPRCSAWDFLMNSHATMSIDDRSGWRNPTAQEQVTAVLATCGTVGDSRRQALTWLALSLNTASLVDALSSLFRNPALLEAYYTPEAFLASEDNRVSMLQLLRPMLALRFQLSLPALQLEALLGPSA
eukprot:RCo030367